MSNARPRRRLGFTLIEAMAAVVLLGIGIVGAMSANAQIIHNEDRARRMELMQRLGQEKLAELQATGQASTSTNGDFTQQNQPDLTWSLDIGTSGITDLDTATLTVPGKGGVDDKYRLDTLIYVPPTTTTTSGTTSGTTGT